MRLFAFCLSLGLVIVSLHQPQDCALHNFDLGLSEHTLEFNGLVRSYLLYLPSDFTPGQPLVISLHGFASNPRQQATFSQWNPIADDHNFAVVYPQGTNFPLRWNAGEFSFVRNRGADDVGFISALINDLATTACIDTTRVYANGLSNGGGMSNRIACEIADKIAAIGSVAGAYTPLPDGCQPTHPIPVMAFHGTDDRIVNYNGNLGLGLPPTEEWAAGWADRNHCDPMPKNLPPQGQVTGIEYVNCEDNAAVIFYTIKDAGHTWPGGGPQPQIGVGRTNRDINASQMMWMFFSQYKKSSKQEEKP